MNDRWLKIYEENKKLDDIFESNYQDVTDYYKKNGVEFLVELGEFINESKVFKYWSVKKPNQEKLLEEFADTITMTLLFYRLLDLEIEKPIKHLDSDNILEIVNFLFLKGTELMYNLNEELARCLFSNLLYLAQLLELKEEDILTAIETKQKIIRMRLNSEY